jgi:hypothetical protein
LAFRKTCFAQTFPKGRDEVDRKARGRTVKPANYRRARLLRGRGERPPRRTTKQSDEFAPLHLPSDCIVSAQNPYSKMAQEITLARVVRAAVASELQQTWNRPDAQEWAVAYTKIFPAYQLLIESSMKAQEIEKNHEQFDSTRV